jgi:hypothetical protein
MISLEWFGEPGQRDKGFYILSVDKSNTPHDLIHDLGELYTDCNLPNGTPFWYVVEDMGYPIINELLKSKGIEKCLIWWVW